MTNTDFLKHMENLANLFSSKVEASNAQIRVQQDELRVDINKIDSRVTNVEATSEENKTKLDSLQKEILLLKQAYPSHVTQKPSSSLSSGLNPGSTVSSNIVDHSEAANIIWQAKKVLGFSPLSKECVAHLKEELLQSDRSIQDQDVMKVAVKRFLENEMKP